MKIKKMLVVPCRMGIGVGICLLMSVCMVSKQEKEIDLAGLKKLGPLPVRLEGTIYTAPFSRKTCVWFEWIHGAGQTLERGYSFGYGTGLENPVIVKSTVGDLTAYPGRIMLYLAPSFEGRALVDGKERSVMEFCLESGRTYYGFAERFVYHLPPFRFFPFIPRRKTTWILSLSDKPLENNRPLHPLIPTRRGMTG